MKVSISKASGKSRFVKSSVLMVCMASLLCLAAVHNFNKVEGHYWYQGETYDKQKYESMDECKRAYRKYCYKYSWFGLVLVDGVMKTGVDYDEGEY